jgi:L-cysteine desulfidase
MEQNMFIRILNSEMELATGCTEPGAVALTAAEAGQALRKAGVDKAEEITVNASINIIKNAMSAGIPGTDYEGMDYAAAIGALGGDPVYLLEVMNHVPRETVESAAALVKAGKVRVNVAQVPQKLYIEVIAKGGGHTGRAIVRDLHTNVVLVEQDGVATLDKRDTDTAAAGDSDVVSPEQIASFLTVRSIWDYCTKELDPMNDPIDIIRSAVKVNSVISDEGLSKEYGLAIGRNLDLNCRKGLMTRDLTTNSMIAAAAGADARMAGAPVSVVANSGSGNQGITCSVPLIEYAKELHSGKEKLYRALIISNLVAIHEKTGIGTLSAYCGAVSAGAGAGAGIVYLCGDGYQAAIHTVVNALAIVSGIVCDGAKADCALKISTCVNAACQAAAMGTRGVRVQSTDGIVEENVERTLDNFAILSTHGTSDSVILDLMLNKEHAPDAE